MLVLNDLHLGVTRSAGTTPASREALRSYLFTEFRSILETTTETKLCILGDLFDEFSVDERDWIETFTILSNWLQTKQLILVAGNHDWVARGVKVSSFEMLSRVLKQEYGDSVTVVDIDGTYTLRFEFDGTGPGVTFIAHHSNQEIFDVALQSAVKKTNPGDRVLLHANYDNHFAVNSDHSLNVSVDQARAFASRGATLYFAHEHQARTELGGSVVVFGNQWPTSISDCLGNTTKSAHILSGGVTTVPTWSMEDEDGFAEVDWRDLHSPEICTGFIRVSGDASSNEAGEVITAIARFRSKSKALVISNAVKIDGIVRQEELDESFEATKAFDVLSFIKDNVAPEQWEAIQQLNKVDE